MSNIKELLVIGLMSGTSADGIDACLVKINPDFTFEKIESLIYEFPENIRQQIFKLFSPDASIKDLCKMNFVIGECHALAALNVIKKAGLKPKDIDLIGSHGQTVYHFPYDEMIDNLNTKSTLQIGEPSVIAEKTGITTIADFRPMDIAAGGQGAPLVCFADEIFFKTNKLSRAIQNIGGMANVTLVSPNSETFAFDTGPGNVLIDYFVKKFFDKDYDENGEIASNGNIDEVWLNELLKDEYYKLMPPKTTGREYFSEKYAEKILLTAPENNYSIVSTITALTAKSIFLSYKDYVFPKTNIDQVIIGGGGSYNLTILNLLKAYFGDKTQILTHEDLGISSKFKEAIAFALLAYTTFYNIPNNVAGCTGASKNVVLGKIIPGLNLKSLINKQ